MILIMLGCLGLSLVTYIAWTFIHEFSHALFGKIFLGATDFKYCWLPKKEEDGWTVASVQMSCDIEKMTNTNLGLMSAAPAIINLIAILLFAFLANGAWGWWSATLNIFLFGGFVDLLSNTFAKKTETDIKKVAEYTHIPLKSWQLTVVLVCVACFAGGAVRMFT